MPLSDDHIKSDIASYLAGGLAESRNRQVEAHAAACEKCRNALTKARAKLARGKREALKKASSDPLPNLFLARQGKETGVDRTPSKGPWIFLGFLLVGGLLFWGTRRFSLLKHPSIPPETVADAPGLPVSSAAVVSPLSPTVAAPVVSTPVVVASAPKPKPESAMEFPVQKEWRGAESAIQEPRLVVIRRHDAWQKLWSDMQMSDPLPDVNFESHVILGVFTGADGSGSAISFGKIREIDDEIYAPFRTTPVVATSEAPVTLSHPYLLAQIAHTDKRIRITQKEASQ